MIIDALLDYKADMNDWLKLDTFERIRAGHPRLNLDYIEQEAEVFGFDYLKDIKGLYAFELHKLFKKYLKDNGYNEEIAECVYM